MTWSYEIPEDHIVWADQFNSEVVLPSRSAYQYGCHCAACRAANAAYFKEYRKTKKKLDQASINRL